MDKKGKTKHKTVYISPSKIIANANQPRKVFSQKKIDALANSIREDGLISPISVRPAENGMFELIAGERRLRACIQVGYRRIPCIVSKATEKESATLALSENLLREDLNFFEEALALENLLKEFGYTQEELAKKLGMSQSAVANKIRLLKLPITIKEKIISQGLTERHARELLKLEQEERMEYALKKIISKGLNVKETEILVDKMRAGMIKKEPGNKKYVMKDIRIFANTINHAVEVMQSAGISAVSQRQESDGFIVYTIKIPKTT
ncbi:MAG: ParB/RepB/Spo0J family partition protein [Clostridia bacterium]|nr:ParB/RepB/Spo0J family partition protein [Clostridia bacterium]